VIKNFIDKLSDNSQQEINQFFKTIVVLRSPLTKWQYPIEIKEEEELISLNNIGGFEKIINQATLSLSVSLIVNSQPLRTQLGYLSAQNMLFYGRHGMGKTSLALALANSFMVNKDCLACVSVLSCSELSTQRLITIKERIDLSFLKAIQKQPSILILDDIDSLVPKEDENPNQASDKLYSLVYANHIIGHMNQIKSLSHSIVVLATAQDVNKVHSILLSPHLFGLQLELTLPSKVERKEIMQKNNEER
jgi:SpoVK/Ycf46/Vps4 family AAA+-type ATPase